jgi:hypothetical protein
MTSNRTISLPILVLMLCYDARDSSVELLRRIACSGFVYRKPFRRWPAVDSVMGSKDASLTASDARQETHQVA